MILPLKNHSCQIVFWALNFRPIPRTNGCSIAREGVSRNRNLQSRSQQKPGIVAWGKEEGTTTLYGIEQYTVFQGIVVDAAKAGNRILRS
jgi:hypothetical protein